MRHARQHSESRVRERRQRIAHEAARLMADGTIGDYQQAKLKAAGRLGIHDEASLPRNREIEEALREHQRLFVGQAHASVVRARREVALQALEFFEPFHPRLAGAVLEGTAAANSPVQLHLHSDDPDAVMLFLAQHRIPADTGARRLRLDRNRSADAPTWHFEVEGTGIELIVLPHDALRQAPLSALDDKPMWRASAAQLRQLIDQELPVP
jgi:hypothetical protein